ncbi:MAG: hypothetical protein H6628_14165 [Calditrichae bacterium]|nr:hypothetical protein [Calditrichia bacterium]
MKSKFWASSLCIAMLTTSLLAGVYISLKDLIEHRQTYDGKIVTVRGEINNLQEKTTRRGNKFFTFKLVEKADVVSVFAFGEAEVANGQYVEVNGKFHAVNFVDREYYNQIDATEGEIRPLIEHVGW